MRTAGLVLISLLVSALCGCTLATTAPPVPVAGAAIRGVVHGGQQPVTGASVYLYAAGTSGYGGSSVSLLNSSVLTNNAGFSGQDTNGNYYITTDSSGQFNITGDYLCTSGQQLYLYILGGNPGAGTNNASGLMAILGNCPSGGAAALASQIPFVNISEVSTVAAAYSFAGFATDATHVSSSGSPSALVGIQSAFATAASLVSLSSGAAYTLTPVGAGFVYQARLNTLANILAACVNTTGTVTGPTNPTPCYTLFNNALSGGTTGSIPTDTATAAINIAHNPGANVAALWGIPAPSPAFGPALTSQPTDFTLVVLYAADPSSSSAGGTATLAVDQGNNLWITDSEGLKEINNQGVPYSYSPITSACFSTTCISPLGLLDVAIDSQGNAWVAGGSVTFAVCATTGLPCSSAYTSGTSSSLPGLVGVNLNAASALAFDANQNLWVANRNTSNNPYYGLTELKGVGLSTAGTTSFANYQYFSKPTSIALDTSGNSWVLDGGNKAIYETSSLGAVVNTISTQPFASQPNAYTALAFDQGGNVFAVASGELIKFNSSGTLLSGNGYYYGSSLSINALAVDGSNRIWVLNSVSSSSVGLFSDTGTLLSPTTGFSYPGFQNPVALAVDEAGNLWVAKSSPTLFSSNPTYYSTIVKFVGLATPVLTPTAAGLSSGVYASKP